jgi:hypothetical protein
MYKVYFYIVKVNLLIVKKEVLKTGGDLRYLIGNYPAAD